MGKGSAPTKDQWLKIVKDIFSMEKLTTYIETGEMYVIQDSKWRRGNRAANKLTNRIA